jgi:transposase
MQAVKTIGLDIAKSVFQVHGVDVEGQVAIRRKLKRRYVLAFFEKLPPCLIGMEACATSHHWSRELQALGHRVRLMPPAYVRPYVKRQKNDAADAEAICEAVRRARDQGAAELPGASSHAAPVHSSADLADQRHPRASCRVWHCRAGRSQRPGPTARCREQFRRQTDPVVVRACVVALGAQLRALKAQILEFDRQIVLWHRSHETSKRLDEVPGVGPALATALVASIADPKHSARGVTSQPGSAWCLSSIRAGAKTSSAVSASKVIATCAACSRRARLL